MAASKDDIFRDALALAERDRADLIAALIDSFDTDHEDGVEAAWRAEIDRRARELETGAVQAVPWEVARARIARD